MNNYVLPTIKDKFSRLFVLAAEYKMNFKAFTTLLCKSEFVKQIEKDEYDPSLDEEIHKTFSKIIGYEVKEDSSYGIYNDAYWAGKNYFDIFLKTRKSFEYIFLKLPMEEMMNLYVIFHEMDFSSLEMLFRSRVEELPILKALTKKYGCTLTYVSKATSIPLSTLKKYSQSDESLYKAEFQTISKLVKFFDVGYSLFIR